MPFDIYLFTKLGGINNVIYEIKNIYEQFSIENHKRAANLKEKKIL